MSKKHIGAKAGQVWRMRNGDTIKIEKVDPENGKFPILVGTSSWMADGKYWAPRYNHGKDLIEKVSD